jgi:hypothetical protein
MKIQAKWEVSYSEAWVEYDLEDLNLTESEWNELTQKEKEIRIQDRIDELADAPSLILTKFRTFN